MFRDLGYPCQPESKFIFGFTLSHLFCKQYFLARSLDLRTGLKQFDTETLHFLRPIFSAIKERTQYEAAFYMIVRGTLLTTLSLVGAAFAFQDASTTSQINSWSDSAWNAAQRADVKAFEQAIDTAPTGDSASIKALQDAIALRKTHRVEQEKSVKNPSSLGAKNW